MRTNIALISNFLCLFNFSFWTVEGLLSEKAVNGFIKNNNNKKKINIFTLGLLSLTDHVCHRFLALTGYWSSVHRSSTVEYILLRNHHAWAYSDAQIANLKRQHLILHEFLWRLQRHNFLGYGRKLSFIS